jgi:hypothetical protein
MRRPYRASARITGTPLPTLTLLLGTAIADIVPLNFTAITSDTGPGKLVEELISKNLRSRK